VSIVVKSKISPVEREISPFLRTGDCRARFWGRRLYNSVVHSEALHDDPKKGTKYSRVQELIVGTAINLRPSDLGGNAKYGKRKSKMPPLSFDSLYSTSLSATSLTGEAADRVAIRELIDAWAHCANYKFVREGNRWLFAERQVITDWTDRYQSSVA